MRVTYHDPCHLGRGQGIYEAPREVSTSIKGATLIIKEQGGDKNGCIMMSKQEAVCVTKCWTNKEQ